MKFKKGISLLIATMMLFSVFALTACGGSDDKAADIDRDLLKQVNKGIANMGKADGMDLDLSAYSYAAGSPGKPEKSVEYSFKGNKLYKAQKADAIIKVRAAEDGKYKKANYYIKDGYMYSDSQEGKLKAKLSKGHTAGLIGLPIISTVIGGVEIEKKEIKSLQQLDDGRIEATYDKSKIDAEKMLPKGMEDAQVVVVFALDGDRIKSVEATIGDFENSQEKTLRYEMGVKKMGKLEIKMPDDLDTYKEKK